MFKKILTSTILLTGMTAIAQQPIQFDEGYNEVSKNVQAAAQKAAIDNCTLTGSATIQKYEKTVDHIDQGIVDINHNFYLFSYQAGKLLVSVYEPMYPNYNDRISATCKRIK